MNNFFNHIASYFFETFKNYLPLRQKLNFKTNLKNNWFFPISALFFFLLNATLTSGYIIGIILSFIISIIIASQITSIFSYIKKQNKYLRLFSLINACGICLAGQNTFYKEWSLSSKTQALENILSLPFDVSFVISFLFALLAIYFVYFFVITFWKNIISLFRKVKIFNNIEKYEKITYLSLIILSLGFMIFSFSNSQAFYGTDFLYDTIYTSDSTSIVRDNAYINLTHTENDIRQPLFAIFSAPFVGIPYFISTLINANECVHAILINIVQIILLFIANFMLTKIMKLSPLKRICFMLIASCTYMNLLFTLMMEQYIISYFWLIFCILIIVERKQSQRVLIWGAGGTLITSLSLLPFFSKQNLFKNFKEWFSDMFHYVLEFITLLLIFCRFDSLFYFINNLFALSSFTGKDITFLDKLHQYIEFIFSCFVSPNAGIESTAIEHISWQINTITEINVFGIVILLLVIISAIWNRDKKSSLLASYWVLFSMLILLIIGWGTAENGLILYSLYFGWAFLLLLFQLIEKIENKFNKKFIIPSFTIIIVILLLMNNIPSIIEMLNFAINNYPV
ncbi:MAG: hypothetical protein IJ463_05835 [Bacilli bacterium]|nr:hypothetical protein [Bacilli bacterium]